MGLSIDREKVIKKLESLRDICNAKSNMAIGNGKVAWAGYANTADEAIALLKGQEADKWVSVTDRLPEVRHAVLCYTPHYNNIWALSLHEYGEWYYWIPMYRKYNPDFEGPITHWMPLPDNPRGKAVKLE